MDELDRAFEAEAGAATGRAKKAPRPRRAKAPPPPQPTGVPSWLGQPGEAAAQIRARLGLSVATYHPSPVMEEGGIARLLSPEEEAQGRDAVWRAALDDGGPGLTIVSMDPGTRNFALRVERRHRCGRSRTLYFNVLDLDPGADARRTAEGVPAAKRRKTGKSDEFGVLRTHAVLHAAFYSNPLREWLQGAHVVLIEKQEFDNNLATRISMHALGLIQGLLSLQSERTYALVMETSTKLKNQVIQVPRDVAARTSPDMAEGQGTVLAPLVKGLTRHFLKKCATSTALTYLRRYGDEEGIRTIEDVPRERPRARRGKGADAEDKPGAAGPAGEPALTRAKKDDLADTVCHIEAWRAFVGWLDVEPVRTPDVLCVTHATSWAAE